MSLARRLPDPQALDELRGATGPTGILVHLSPLDPRAARWQAYLKRDGPTDLCRVARDGTALPFAVSDGGVCNPRRTDL